MANVKRISFPWSETGITVYYICRREVDNYRMDDSDGDFALNPADPYQELAEDAVIKGLYEADESRVAWDDGRYTFVFYKQAGGSPVPASDTPIGNGEMWIKDDLELSLDDVPDQVWDEVLTGATHNIATSAGRRLRGIQDFQGYENGSIWIDTINGVAGTTDFENGTVENPVDSLADALTIATSLNMTRFTVVNGSTITLVSSTTNKVFFGDRWSLALGGQDTSGSHFEGAEISGINTGTECHFDNCTFLTCSLSNFHGSDINIKGPLTLISTGDYYLVHSSSNIAGTSAPIIDTGLAIANVNLNIRNYSGGVDLRNLGQAGTDNVSLEGNGQLILNANCIGGTVAIRGNFELTNNGSGMTINDEPRYDSDTLVDLVWDEVLTSATHNINKSSGKRIRELLEVAGYEGGFIYIDTVNGTAGDEPFINGILETPVDNITDANTIAAATGISWFKINAGSTITLVAAQEGQVFTGEIWTLALGGQSVSASTFHGADVTGICTGAIKPKFEHCHLGAVTLPPCHLDTCAFEDTLTLGSAGAYFMADNCHSGVAGTGSPSIDFGAAIGDSQINLRGYYGGIELKNMGQAGTDSVSIEGDGQVIINANSIGGTIAIRGHQTITGAAAFEALGGVISDDARFALDQFPQILISTSIATLASQTVFTISDGSSDNDAYNDALIIITDAATEEQKAVGLVGDYVGSTKQITLSKDPAIFTMAVGDKVNIIGNSSISVLVNATISEKVDTLLDINKSQDLTVNVTTRLEYQWLDSDGNAVDISLLTFKFKAVKNAGEASPAIPEVTGSIQDGPNGRWYFDILPTTVFKGRYEIWAVDGASKITPLTVAGGARIETHPRL
jgi:hypothetical protein